MNASDTYSPTRRGDLPAGASGATQTFAAPLGAATAGRILFADGVEHATLRANPALPDLYRARFEGPQPRVRAEDGTVTIAYGRFPLLDWLYYWWRRTAAEVTLNGSIPWRIEARGGVSHLTADLRGLALQGVHLGGGASRVDLALPAPTGTVPIRVSGGASHLTVRRPSGVPIRLRVGGGTSKLTVDDMQLGAIGGGSRWQSPTYADAPNRYDLEITGGASRLTVITD
jgi:hypothetical protein